MSGSLHPMRTKEVLVTGFESPPPLVLSRRIKSTQITQDLGTLHTTTAHKQPKTDYDAQNFLYLFMLPTLWPYFSTRVRLADPRYPGNNPCYVEGETQTHNAIIRDVWQLERKYHSKLKHMHQTLVDSLLFLIPEEYKQKPPRTPWNSSTAGHYMKGWENASNILRKA